MAVRQMKLCEVLYRQRFSPTQSTFMFCDLIKSPKIHFVTLTRFTTWGGGGRGAKRGQKKLSCNLHMSLFGYHMDIPEMERPFRVKCSSKSILPYPPPPPPPFSLPIRLSLYCRDNFQRGAPSRRKLGRLREISPH